MAVSTYFLLVASLALLTSQAIASDPNPLQDFCVADKNSRGMHARLMMCSYTKYLIK
jgi:hypothetical protein